MPEEWGEYRRQVLSELQHLTEAVKEFDSKLDALEARMTRQEAEQRTRSGILLAIVTVLGVLGTFGQWLLPRK